MYFQFFVAHVVFHFAFVIEDFHGAYPRLPALVAIQGGSSDMPGRPRLPSYSYFSHLSALSPFFSFLASLLILSFFSLCITLSSYFTYPYPVIDSTS